VRPDDLNIPLARQQFPLGVVAGSLALVLRAGTRLKRVALALTLYGNWSGLDVRAASYYSVRLWLLRLGLYQLSRAKTHADDWMWMVDHTMQLGERKCLILVGLRQSAWDAKDRVLGHEDVERIDLVPVTESNGEVVFRQLQAAAAKTGVPRAIVSDDGRDLHSGIDRFRQSHPTTVWLYDIKHKTACLLKHALEGDASWQVFVEKVHRFKQQVSLTSLAALAPPQQRSKARYMNLDALVAWAEDSLRLLDRPPAARRLRKQLLEFVAAQGRQAREGERLLGSSEVLESIIGKFKNVAGERGQHGLTGMALSVGALVGNLAVETVQNAMTEITTQNVWDWCRLHLGPTVQSARQRIRQALQSEQKEKTLRLESG